MSEQESRRVSAGREYAAIFSILISPSKDEGEILTGGLKFGPGPEFGMEGTMRPLLPRVSAQGLCLEPKRMDNACVEPMVTVV